MRTSRSSPAARAQSYTAEDEARRDEMRKRWLTDQLFVDPFASKVVPFEVGSLVEHAADDQVLIASAIPAAGRPHQQQDHR